MSSAPDFSTASPRRQRRHGLARWWLAGLLVGCLLPASLHPSDVFRGGERNASVCFWVPAILRAQSLLIAKKRRALRRLVRRNTRLLTLFSSLVRYFPQVTRRQVAAHDVLTQRGPPAQLSLH